MIKKFELHLDAIVVVVVLFLLSFGANFYQQIQYSGLLQEYVDEKWKSEDLQSQLVVVKAKLEQQESAAIEPGKL